MLTINAQLLLNAGDKFDYRNESADEKITLAK